MNPRGMPGVRHTSHSGSGTGTGTNNNTQSTTYQSPLLSNTSNHSSNRRWSLSLSPMSTVNKKRNENMVLIVSTLLKANPDAVFLRDKDGKRPIDLAREYKADPTMISLLLERARILRRSDSYQTSNYHELQLSNHRSVSMKKASNLEHTNSLHSSCHQQILLTRHPIQTTRFPDPSFATQHVQPVNVVRRDGGYDSTNYAQLQTCNNANLDVNGGPTTACKEDTNEYVPHVVFIHGDDNDSVSSIGSFGSWRKNWQ